LAVRPLLTAKKSVVNNEAAVAAKSIRLNPRRRLRSALRTKFSVHEMSISRKHPMARREWLSSKWGIERRYRIVVDSF
jgi:hypothetical protein